MIHLRVANQQRRCCEATRRRSTASRLPKPPIPVKKSSNDFQSPRLKLNGPLHSICHEPFLIWGQCFALIRCGSEEFKNAHSSEFAVDLMTVSRGMTSR